MHRPPSPDPVHAALVASVVTVAWSAAMGGAGVVIGLREGSLSLGGLGATVLIDLGSSLVLVWRFGHERRGGARVERAERVAHVVASAALAGFGGLLAVQAVRGLAGRAAVEVSAPGVVVAAAGVVVLPLLARWKYAAARAAASPALRADAHITLVGAAVAAVTLAGLVAARVWHARWADGAAALVLAAVAARQGAAGLRAVRRGSGTMGA